jgi:signal transduction histidine kinase
VFGYMMAYLGGHELQLRSRLALLKEVSLIANPRFGINRTIGVIMERLRAFYDADTCMLISIYSKPGEYRLRHVSRSDPDGGIEEKPLDEVKAGHLLAIPDHCAITYSKIKKNLGSERSVYEAYDLVKDEPTLNGQKAAEELADMLDATAYASIPLLIRNKVRGRFFLIRKQRPAFNHADLDFLLQVVEQVIPVIENIMLVDRLATEAAEKERKKIARDIHDSIIQPYIGLQMGLASVDQSLMRSASVEAGAEELKEIVANTRERIERLVEMTESGIKDLRSYIRGLTQTQAYEEILVNSINRFAAKFSNATGIMVTVEAQSLQVSDRLAAEIFQIVAEGLSNTRRHTQSAWAIIRLAQLDDSLVLRIENDNLGNHKATSFMPGSINLRAISLGGFVQIEQSENMTCVMITIPL